MCIRDSYTVNGKVNGSGTSAVAMTMSLGSFVVSVFIALFLFYTNSFLLRRRKKEFGLYSVLGMSKTNIAGIMVFESLYIAVIGIAGGLAVGILLTKLVSLALFKLMRLPVPFGFTVQPIAIIIVVLFFAALIFLTLLVTFRSITLPFILLFVIESAIWINLSVPYFTDTPLVYLGYLVINTVQLGATIDYAILMTEGYVVNRRTMGKREAVEATLTKNFISVLTSGLILSAAGFCLNFSSSLSVVAALGTLLCRGTLLSMAMVLLALPALLMIFDPLTARLTLKSGFLKKTDKEVETK